jgi:hypothetical protein
MKINYKLDGKVVYLSSRLKLKVNMKSSGVCMAQICRNNVGYIQGKIRM